LTLLIQNTEAAS